MIDVPMQFHMWFGLVVTLLSVYSFAKEKISLEMTALSLIAVLLIYGQVFPLLNDSGKNMLDATALLAGFANPSLMAVLALLIMGQGMFQTEALRPVTRLFMVKNRSLGRIAAVFLIFFVLAASAFMNNTPLVILAIPILQSLCNNIQLSESRVMIPLSFGAILGGMTTLIGSSTNLLVSSAMTDLGYEPIGFFDFTIPGMMMAAVGFVYVGFILPFFLPDRASLASRLTGDDKQFIAELDIEEDSPLIGMECHQGSFPKLPDLTVRMIQRSGHVILPPFEGYAIEKNDIIIVAATRQALTDVLSSNPGFLLSDDKIGDVIHRDDDKSETDNQDGYELNTRVLAEIMITPTSRMIDMSLEQAGFDKQFGAVVLGIQRRARVVRRRLGSVKMEAGDVLLIAGSQASLESMRSNPDFIVMAGTIKDMPLTAKAPIALLLFLATIGSAATGILPIPVAAIAGAMAMIATGCLNIRQALRAVDRKIYLLVGAALALGTVLQVTGAAEATAGLLSVMPYADQPLVLASVLFILVAITTNLLTNNATAILYTPIAMSLAQSVGVDPLIFAIVVVMGANCSFASPIGYQTNLMVMGPGHYRFRDFMKAGVPLIIIMWITFTLIAKYHFGL